jgi:hypothetical protein
VRADARGVEDLRHDDVVLERGQRVRFTRAAYHDAWMMPCAFGYSTGNVASSSTRG